MTTGVCDYWCMCLTTHNHYCVIFLLPRWASPYPRLARAATTTTPIAGCASHAAVRAFYPPALT